MEKSLNLSNLANDYLWPTRCELIIWWGTRQARAIADLKMPEREMLFKRKLSIGHDGIIIGIVRFDDTDAKKKKILRVRSTDSWTCRNYADLNIRKEEMKGKRNIWSKRWIQTLNRRPQFHNNISTTRRKRRVTNTSGIATDKSTIDKKNATY